MPKSRPESNPRGFPRCSNVTATGRPCRFPATPDAAFCRSHARIRRPEQFAANPLDGLPPETLQFASYSDITRFLGNLLVLLSENRISPRRAAVLSYIANSILNSLRAAQRQAEYEAKHTTEQIQIDWSGIPRPQRDFDRRIDIAPHSNEPAPDLLVAQNGATNGRQEPGPIHNRPQSLGETEVANPREVSPQQFAANTDEGSSASLTSIAQLSRQHSAPPSSQPPAAVPAPQDAKPKTQIPAQPNPRHIAADWSPPFAFVPLPRRSWPRRKGP